MLRHIGRIIFTLLLTTMLAVPGASTLAREQGGGFDFYIWTVDSAGNPVFDVCYTIVEFSNLGCDENMDGAIYFLDMAPGRYYVEPTTTDGGYHYVEPFYTLIDEYHTDIVVTAEEFRGNSQAQGNTTPIDTELFDLYIVTRDPVTGESLTDVCYQLHTDEPWSQIGCDKNEDGRVTFEDVPMGFYSIHQTTTPAGYETIDPYPIGVMGMPDEEMVKPVSVLIAQSTQQADRGQANASVVFWERGNPDELSDAANCARIMQGNTPITLIGCDEDVFDGQVDFMDVELDFDLMDEYNVQVDLACQFQIAPNAQLDYWWFGEETVSFYVEVVTDPTGCQ